MSQLISNFPDYSLILLFIGAFAFLSFVVMSALSFQEGEKTAGVRCAVLSLFISAPYILLALKQLEMLSIIVIAITALFVLLCVVPNGNKKLQAETVVKIHDERDTMFSRSCLKAGSERFDEYYKRRPENLSRDEAFRSKPGLMSPNGKLADPLISPAIGRCFEGISDLLSADESKVAETKQKTDPSEITESIFNSAKELGAHSIGVTLLRNHHKYSHRGFGDEYGKPLVQDHKYIIVFSVEMTRELNMCAPNPTTTLESARQYRHAAEIALALTRKIKSLGYDAKPHCEGGEYDIVCPLVARDAGLGEIGRNGILMTPKLGPRVRLSAVSTDLELRVSDRNPDYSMIDFCHKCKKCATTCPSGSISHDDIDNTDGLQRWEVDKESCYTYWGIAGTDCGKCMAVCPYSHPDNLLHDVVRYCIKYSGFFRRIGAFLDDIIYGENPKSWKPKKALLEELKDKVS